MAAVNHFNNNPFIQNNNDDNSDYQSVSLHHDIALSQSMANMPVGLNGQVLGSTAKLNMGGLQSKKAQ